MPTTTSATYEHDYAVAAAALHARLGLAGEESAVFADDDGETRKSAADALNNTWAEGITLEAWVRDAARQLGR